MWIYVVAALVGIFALIYSYVTQKYGFFESKGIKADPGYFPLGSTVSWQALLGKRSGVECILELSKKFPNEKVIGYYSMGTPIVVVKDLELVKNVLIKDFDSFQDRRTFAFGKKGKVNEALQRMMLNLKGEEWRVVRAKMSPVFTSGKLKGMTGMINQVGDNLVDHLDKLADSGEEFLAKNTLGLFTLDAIATCGFGVESNSFANPDTALNKMAQEMMNPSLFKFIEVVVMFVLPKLGELLQLSFFNKKSFSVFYSVIQATVNSRKLTSHRRNDFVDHILDALKDKHVQHDDLDKQFEKDAAVTTDKKLNLTEAELERDMVANALLFFFAGLDTTSTVLSVILVTLTFHPDVQERVYEEIRDAVEESQSEGKDTLDYNTAQALPLLDALVHESMRTYPMSFMERVCTKDYPVPDTSLVISKGMIVQVPGTYFHHDTALFPDGEQFNLDNWTPEAKASRSPYAFMTFGQGPRNCIGMRFAMLELKYALIRIMYNFRVVAGPRTPKELKLDPRSFSGLPLGGTWVKVERRD